MIVLTLSAFLLITCLTLVAHFAVEQNRDWYAGYTAGAFWTSLLCASILFLMTLFFTIPFTALDFSKYIEPSTTELPSEVLPASSHKGET